MWDLLLRSRTRTVIWNNLQKKNRKFSIECFPSIYWIKIAPENTNDTRKWEMIILNWPITIVRSHHRRTIITVQNWFGEMCRCSPKPMSTNFCERKRYRNESFTIRRDAWIRVYCWPLWAPGNKNDPRVIQFRAVFWTENVFLCAIFSGAGKSTLMSTLAHRNAAGTTVEGDILVNNRPVGPFMHRLSGFVHQDDLFNGALTVLEHITFMVCGVIDTLQQLFHATNFLFKANLRLDRRLSKSEKCKLVEELLGKLGLMTCIHTRIGHSHKGKTLSGGEKKRLSFASELITKPPLLFCDEPTTGLGACVMWYVNEENLLSIHTYVHFRCLWGTAARTHFTIVGRTRDHNTLHDSSALESSVCHVPSGAVLGRRTNGIHGTTRRSGHIFRRVCILSLQAVADTNWNFPLFSNGFQCPSTYNPADYIIGTLATTGHMNDPHKFSDRICDAYAASQILETKKLQSVSKESLDDDVSEFICSP